MSSEHVLSFPTDWIAWGNALVGIGLPLPGRLFSGDVQHVLVCFGGLQIEPKSIIVRTERRCSEEYESHSFTRGSTKCAHCGLELALLETSAWTFGYTLQHTESGLYRTVIDTYDAKKHGPFGAITAYEAARKAQEQLLARIAWHGDAPFYIVSSDEGIEVYGQSQFNRDYPLLLGIAGPYVSLNPALADAYAARRGKDIGLKEPERIAIPA